MSGKDRDLERIEELEGQVARLEAQLESANRNIKGLMSDSRFWRTAAEQAVSGWTALEDKVDLAVQKLQAEDDDGAASKIADALEVLVDADPLEPPDVDLMNQSVDIGNGEKLTLVEEETPIAGVGIVKDE